jgi:hypothetical protein
MTDSEKLDLLLSGMAEMKSLLKRIDRGFTRAGSELLEMKGETDEIGARLTLVEQRLKNLENERRQHRERFCSISSKPRVKPRSPPIHT